ncbi:cAMP receptor-like protein [Cavenderia fasciculata]|uniref:cAMP receptor-like protein n=1 Tax=Cavenderia fasciculata TaxID=261658 RepID=F4PSL7_CACFS|nr:cAMP receptor-like protein [Cavenderia fasciculata]EGG20709.1 cAMP receptor-like protein [Cavenderia fasciculata]|eukprot:XP_004358559.1 cAMP receptor-like protein [Cavenderia fasciculata]
MIDQFYISTNSHSNSNSSNGTSSSSTATTTTTTTTTTEQFTDEQIASLDKIVYVTSSLGCAGALFIIVSYLLFKDIRSFATKLIFYLSLSDLMSALSYLPFGRRSNVLCDMQGMGLLFFLTSSYFWTMCISISLFLVFFTNRYELNYLLRYYHYVCWGIPLFSTSVSLIFGAYGRTGSWCFIADPTSFFRLFYYLPLIVVFFVNLVVFICIRWKVSQHSNSLVSKVNIIVSFYLLAFALSQLPTIINIYGFNEGFVSHYVEFFERHVFRCRKSREMRQIEVDTTSLLVDYENSDEESSTTNMDRFIIDDYSSHL